MGFNGVTAVDPRKEEVAFETGRLVMDLLRKGVLPRRIITKKALHNSIAGVMATGGSTNAVLHLLAIAKEAGVKLASTSSTRSPARRRCWRTCGRGATTPRPRCTRPAAWGSSPSDCSRPACSTPTS